MHQISLTYSQSRTASNIDLRYRVHNQGPADTPLAFICPISHQVCDWKHNLWTIFVHLWIVCVCLCVCVCVQLRVFQMPQYPDRFLQSCIQAGVKLHTYAHLLLSPRCCVQHATHDHVLQSCNQAGVKFYTYAHLLLFPLCHVQQTTHHHCL